MWTDRELHLLGAVEQGMKNHPLIIALIKRIEALEKAQDEKGGDDE